MLTGKYAKDRNQAQDHFFPVFAAGIADGLIVPFALLAGGTSIINAAGNIVPFIFLFTILASLLMAGGNYFTTRKQQYERQTSAEQKKRDTRKFFANLDLPEEIQEQSAIDLLKENEVWDQMDNRENSVNKSPSLSGFITGISYFMGGFVSMIPFLFVESSVTALKISALITLPALFIVGYFKARNDHSSPWRSALRMVLTGIIAAGAAFGIAKLF